MRRWSLQPRRRGPEPRAYDGPLLSCQSVDVAYDGVPVLFGVDLTVESGEVVALLGTNGAGKSTLLRAVSGIVPTTGGTIGFAGQDITHADAVSVAQQGIAHVPGGRAVFPTLTVAEHFTAAGWLWARADPGGVRRRTEQAMDTFPRLGERWGQRAGDLSGGEQQQLALGMAFLAEPRLLVVDELSLGLAPTMVAELVDVLRAMQAAGTAVLLVEQSLDVALEIASRAYFLEKGEVRYTGPAHDLLARTDLLRSVFLPSDAAQARREPAAEPARTVLEVRGLSRRFGGITAVRDVAVTLCAGQVVGLIGGNGAGKTTILDLISGHLPCDSGRVVLGGVDITGWSAARRARQGLGRSFQDGRLFPSLTVAENLAFGLERHIEVADPVSALFATPAMRDSEADVAYTVGDLLELLGLQAYRDFLVAELSTGSRRVVELAMSMAHDPTVLLLDEPSSGLAQREVEALGPLLLRLRDDTDCAILLVEHDIALVAGVSDELVALELGAVVAQGPPDVVLNDERVIASYLGAHAATVVRAGEATVAPP